jgi:hypothetical protein
MSDSFKLVLLLLLIRVLFLSTSFSQVGLPVDTINMSFRIYVVHGTTSSTIYCVSDSGSWQSCISIYLKYILFINLLFKLRCLFIHYLVLKEHLAQASDEFQEWSLPQPRNTCSSSSCCERRNFFKNLILPLAVTGEGHRRYPIGTFRMISHIHQRLSHAFLSSSYHHHLTHSLSNAVSIASKKVSHFVLPASK